MNHRDFWPFFEAAQSLGIPLERPSDCGADGQPGLYGIQSAGSERFDRFFFTHIVGFPFELMIAVLSIVGGGIFERFPRLKIAFLEGGAGWLPFWMERIDEHYEKLAPQVPELRKRPSEYIKSENFYISTEAEESMLPAVCGRGQNTLRLRFSASGLQLPEQCAPHLGATECLGSSEAQAIWETMRQHFTNSNSRLRADG